MLIAIVLLVVATGWIALKTRSAYCSFGGREPVTVYDAATWPPFLIAIAAYLIASTYEVALPGWSYIAIWVASVVSIIGIIKLGMIMGDKPLC
ncbi:MAG: hypothetical protein ACI9HK_004233 [Pirellulaceae bacterium]|jgi:hypothetical protein